MIDNLAILIFGSLVVYTAFKAVQMDKIIPWFGEKKHKDEHSSEDS